MDFAWFLSPIRYVVRSSWRLWSNSCMRRFTSCAKARGASMVLDSMLPARLLSPERALVVIVVSVASVPSHPTEREDECPNLPEASRDQTYQTRFACVHSGYSSQTSSSQDSLKSRRSAKMCKLRGLSPTKGDPVHSSPPPTACCYT